MVDLTPEVLQNRMKRGDVYGSEKVERSLKNFFRRGNFIALRELALRQVDVDREFGAKEPNKDTLIANLRFAESLGAQVVRLKGRSVADSVAEFVRSKHVTQVIFGPRRDSRLAQVPLSIGRSSFPSRIARGGRSHCHPGI